jgi:hypothetical protein
MLMKTIPEIINLLKKNWSSPTQAYHGGEKVDFLLTCQFRSAGTHIDSNYPFSVPEDLKEFWSIAASAELFKDNEYGQWGLQILSPHESLLVTNEEKESRSEDFKKNDLVIGKFIGDSDLLVLSAEEDSQYYNSILIALPIDHRKEWYKVASGFAAFLDSYVEHQGEKYWEVGLRPD